MSKADIETLRGAYEAANRRDWAAMLDQMDPDFEWKTALAGTHRGREEVTRFLEDMVSAFGEVVVEPDEFFDRGDRIVVYVRMKAQPLGTDAVVENRVGHLWTLRDGKPVRCETFPRREDALEAVEADQRETPG
jgi:ketosteroid isomerase-like protein